VFFWVFIRVMCLGACMILSPRFFLCINCMIWCAWIWVSLIDVWVQFVVCGKVIDLLNIQYIASRRCVEVEIIDAGWILV